MLLGAEGRGWRKRGKMIIWKVNELKSGMGSRRGNASNTGEKMIRYKGYFGVENDISWQGEHILLSDVLALGGGAMLGHKSRPENTIVRGTSSDLSYEAMGEEVNSPDDAVLTRRD